jgi:hypothetical protein
LIICLIWRSLFDIASIHFFVQTITIFRLLYLIFNVAILLGNRIFAREFSLRSRWSGWSRGKKGRSYLMGRTIPAGDRLSGDSRSCLDLQLLAVSRSCKKSERAAGTFQKMLWPPFGGSKVISLS